MKAIVTGGTGFVGRYLVNALVQQGIHVVMLVHKNKPNFVSNKVDVIPIDLNKQVNESSMLINLPADIFFHFAWEGTSGDVRKDESIQISNIINTCNAMKLAKKCGCQKFIYAGSIMEYEAASIFLQKEYSISASMFYSFGKLTADCYAQMLAGKNKIDYVNVLISNIYGPGEESDRFINNTLKKMMRNERIPLSNCLRLYDFIYITDAVDMILLAALKGKSAQYYIGNIEQKILKDYVLDMKKAIKSKSELCFGEIKDTNVCIDYSLLDCRRLLEEFGIYPKIDFSTGILNTYKSLLENASGED